MTPRQPLGWRLVVFEVRLVTASTNGPWAAETRYLRIGELLVDLRYRRVLAAGSEVELPQRLFELLLLLLAEPHVLHSRSELFERLWPGVIVEDANLSQSMWLLRRALGDERKHWIRTVAKGGYVFEPPTPIEALTELAGHGGCGGAAADPPTAASGDLTSAAGGSLAIPDLPRAPADVAVGGRALRSMRLDRWRGWAVAASVVAAVAFGLAWHRSHEPQAIAAPLLQPLSVVLIDVEDSGSSAHWPVKLLHAWLGWKLGSLPEVTLLSEAEFAADSRPTAPQVVFLSSRGVPGNPEQVMLRARFQQAGREQRIELSGPTAQVPTMVDGLSRKLMARLVPKRAEPWPALTLDAPAARRYADAVDAIERRDAMAAAAVLADVVRMAPRFGLARMQLAQAQARLAQASSAVEQMEAARPLLQPAPAEVTELLDAQRLALDPEYSQQATDAFAKLATRYPDKTDYSLEYADQLLGAGQLEQAQTILSAPHWDNEPLGTRISRLISLTQLHSALGDPERMRRYARAAERLARDAGTGWEMERGAALLQAAIADTMQYQERAGTQGYEQAAKQLDLAGNHTLALYARFLAETAAPPASGPNPRMDALLAEARQGGYRSLEIDILAQVADQYYSAGDLVTYRRRLEEALVAAQAAGNAQARDQLTVSLLIEDIAGARFASADARMRRLRTAKFQGAAAAALDQIDAEFDSFRGQYARSIRSLDRADRQLAELQPGSGITQPQADLACVRAGARLPLGDLAGARNDLKRCATSDDPTTQLLMVLGRANTELLAGDRAEAGELLRRALSILPTLQDGPGRWEHTIHAAMLLTRIGDTAESERLYNRVLPIFRSVGYQWFVASAETGLAEDAAARGDWSSTQQHVASARRGLPADAWSLVSRLDLLDIATAVVRGERPRAVAIARQLHAKAHRLDDKVAEMQIHSLLPPGFIGDDCSQLGRDAVVARSGMRGATLDWLAALRTDPVAKLALGDTPLGGKP
jgi:DNA-binding winged helix-turn-helix (wHTH) protein